jgi:NDP-sugar pyrophosphorylase family protein
MGLMIDTAVVLAAGEGKRMQPLSKELPKEMLPVLDRPFMSFILDFLEDAGIKNVAIVTSPRKKIIRKFCGRRYKKMKLFYFTQEEQLGPAHAILSAKSFLKNKEFFLVQYGDSLAEINLPRETIRRFESEKKRVDAFLSLRPVDDPSRYGVVRFGFGGRIVEIVEKPKPQEAPSKIATLGTFILNSSSYFNGIEGAKFGKGEQFPAHYVLKNGGSVKGWVFRGERVDLGFPKDLIQASKLIVSSYGGLLVESEGIDKNVKIKPPVFVGEGCVIEKNCVIGPNAFIGKDTIIKEGSEIRESCVMMNCKIGRNCKIFNAIIWKDSEIPDHSGMANKVFLGGVHDICYTL